MGLRWRNAGYAVLLVAAGLIVWWVVYRDPAALTTEIYDLGDLLHGLPLRRPLRAVQPAAVFNRADDVDEDDWKGIVQTIVGPASWSDHGGLGAAYRVGDSLVVLQSAENHALILEFFQSIRASRATLAGLDLSSTEGDVQVVEILTGRLANAVANPTARLEAGGPHWCAACRR